MISSDPELDLKVKKSKWNLKFSISLFTYRIDKSILVLFPPTASEKISENMHIIANDPSLAFYRLQEHIRKGMNKQNFIIFQFDFVY